MRVKEDFNLSVLTDITELEHAKEELVESEQRLSLIYNSSNDQLGLAEVTKDKSFRFVSANKKAKEGFKKNGIKDSAYYGVDLVTYCTKTLHRNKQEAIEMAKLYAKVATTKKAETTESKVEVPNGSILYIQTDLNPVLDSNGNCTHILWASRDVTENRLAEEKIKESERFKTSLFNSIPGVVYHCTADLHWVPDLMSAGCLDLTGYSSEEFTGKKAWDTIVHPEDLDHVRDVVDKAIKEKTDFEIEYRIIHKKGHVVQVYEKGSCHQNKKGEVIALEGLIIDVTEKAQALEALRKSELKFRSLAENAPDYIVQMNTKGVIQYLNKAPEGFKIKQLVGRSQYEFLSEDHTKVVKKLLREVITSGKMKAIELNTEYKNVSMWFGVRYGPLTDDGKVTSIIAIASDITQTRKVEEELKRSEDKWRSLVENAPNYIATINKDNIITFINRTGKGYLLNDILGESVFHAVDKPFKPKLKRALDSVRQTGRRQRVEVAGMDKHGNTTWYDVHFSPIHQNYRDDLIAIASNITHTKRIEEQLRQSETKYRELFENASEPIFIIDANTRQIINVNQKAVEEYGYQKEEIINKSLKSIAGPHGVKSVDRIISSLLKKGKGVYEYAHQRKDRSVFPVEISSCVINYEGRKAFQSFARDITERKRAEERIKASEQRMKAILSGVPDLILRFNKEGFYIDYYYTGKPSDLVIKPEDFLSKNIADVLPRELASMILKKIRKAINTGIIQTHEYTFAANGKNRESETRIVKIADDEALVIVRNMTEQVKAKRQLLAYQEKLSELAQSIENAREEEKRNIALEIHDVFGQELTGIKMGLFLLQKQLKDNSLAEEKKRAQLMKRTKSLIEQTANAMEDVRRISYELRPTIIDDLGLIPAIEWVMTNFEKEHKITTALHVGFDENEIGFNPDFSITVYRILQEALTNVLRHAKASKVSVNFTNRDKEIHLEIRDNGIGINTNKIKERKSIGIVGMKERIKKWGGTLEVINKNGTLLSFNFPVASIAKQKND